MKDQIEYHYRKGRIYQYIGKTNEAIEAYKLAMEKGKKTNYYFPASASLQLGLIYEEQQEWEKAKASFHRCLEMKNHEYKNSIDTRAKSGIDRVKTKLKDS